MSRIKEISATELPQLIDSTDHFEWVDIRTPAEIEQGIIQEAKIYPYI